MTLLYLAAAAVLLFYLGAPLLVRANLVLALHPHPARVQLQDLPPAAIAFIGVTTPGFKASGFDLVLYFRHEAANVVAHSALWTDRQAGRSAIAVVTEPSSPAANTATAAVMTKAYIELETQLGNGLVVLTNNSPDLGAFKPSPRKLIMRAIHLKEPEDLYRLHVHREATLLPPGEARFIPEPGKELRVLEESMAWDLRQQLVSGYFATADQLQMKPTYVGAYLMSWQLMAPWKQLRLAASNREAQRAWAEAQAAPAPTAPRGVRITHDSPYR